MCGLNRPPVWIFVLSDSPNLQTDQGEQDGPGEERLNLRHGLSPTGNHTPSVPGPRGAFSVSVVVVVVQLGSFSQQMGILPIKREQQTREAEGGEEALEEGPCRVWREVDDSFVAVVAVVMADSIVMGRHGGEARHLGGSDVVSALSLGQQALHLEGSLHEVGF